MSRYTGIIDYYDLLMTQSYYDYQGMVNAVYSLMKGGQKKILELGVGGGPCNLPSRVVIWKTE
ncbi:MAG: hypothetical protein MGF17_13210 [Trichodesmium sp. MAG_R04]|nr:hypothetical protein [Trichodesmium sp. MAG_R04]